MLHADCLTGKEEDLVDGPRPSATQDTEDELRSSTEGPDGKAGLPHHWNLQNNVKDQTSNLLITCLCSLL